MSKVATALAGTQLKFAHFGWQAAPAGDYGVYSEEGGNEFHAEGGYVYEQAERGSVDYFTRDDTGAAKATIETALNTVPGTWYLNTIQYEEDTGYIHYEWIYEAL